LSGREHNKNIRIGGPGVKDICPSVAALVGVRCRPIVGSPPFSSALPSAADQL
jgi:hypothetical protein